LQHEKNCRNHKCSIVRPLPLNLAWECWLIWICPAITEGKHFNGCIGKLKQVASDGTTIVSMIQMFISICFTTFHWTLPKYDIGLGFDISKLKENTLFFIRKRFLEAFVEFQTIWQW